MKRFIPPPYLYYYRTRRRDPINWLAVAICLAVFILFLASFIVKAREDIQ